MFLHRNYSEDSEGHSCGQLVIGSFMTTTGPLMQHVSCRVFWQNIKSPRWLSPLQLRFGTLRLLAFPKLKSPLKGNRYQTINEIQDNLIRQLMVIGRTVWGLEVPTLKGTEVSLSYAQSFVYLVIFFNKCLYFSYYMVGYFLDRPHISGSGLISRLL